MTHYVLIYIIIGGKILLTRAHVVGLGRESLILGLPWLQRYNPMIDWKTGSFHFRNKFQKTAICEAVCRTRLNQKKAFIGVFNKTSPRKTVVEQPPRKTEPI